MTKAVQESILYFLHIYTFVCETTQKKGKDLLPKNVQKKINFLRKNPLEMKINFHFLHFFMVRLLCS